MMSMLLVLLAVTSISVLLLVGVWGWYQWSRRRHLALARSLPTALPTIPLLGHLHHLLGKKVEERFYKMISYPVGGTSCIWVGPVPLIVVSRAEDIKRVLTSPNMLEKGHVYHVLHILIGNGLIQAPVNIWKKTRRHLQSLFHLRNLQHSVPSFNQTSQELVESLDRHVGQGHVDLKPDMVFHSVTNIYNVLFGSDMKIHNKVETFEEFIDFMNRYNSACSPSAQFSNYQRLWTEMEMGFIIINRLRYVWQWWDVPFRFLHKQLLDSIDKVTNNILGAVLREMNEERNNQPLTNHTTDCTTGSEQLTQNGDPQGPVTLARVFQILQRKSPNFSLKYMEDEIKTLFLTGSHTVAVAMCSSLVTLGSHAHIQKKLYKEIVDVVGDRSKEITMEDIKKMVYLEQVLNEAMRRFAIVPIIARRSDVDLRLSDCTIPAGSDIVISTAALHMNPDIYPEPYTFDPDRFSPDRVCRRSDYTFLPFSGGPRNCIGIDYAMVFMKITMAHLLREYSVVSDTVINEMTFKYGITLVCKEGYKVQLRRRKGHSSP